MCSVFMISITELSAAAAAAAAAVRHVLTDSGLGRPVRPLTDAKTLLI